MGIFSKDKKLKVAPRSQGSTEGENYLRSLLTQTPTQPLQGTAGLSPIQQLIQQQLGGSLSGASDAANLARDEYRSVLTDSRDPQTDPYYQSIRSEGERLKTKAITGNRQDAQKLGGLQSTPARGQELETSRAYDSSIMQVLGSLMEGDKDRRLQAAEGVQRGEAQNIQNVGAISNISDLSRAIEQQRADALYTQALKQIMMPYETMANLAMGMMNYQMPTYTTGGGLTDLGFLTLVGSNAVSSYYGAQA